MKQYFVNAFTEAGLKGNPAAVCVLDKWLPNEVMLKIAKINNLSETAYAVKEEEGVFGLRWFTPGGEIDLCGHATLATGYVIMNLYYPELKSVSFETKSGKLTVERQGDLYEMDFPAYELKPIIVTEEMTAALGARPKEAYLGRDLLCVFENEEDVWGLKPDMDKLINLEGLLVQVTAKGKDYDCVSRSFAPKLDVAEDPVCGSGHCHILPYWSKREGKDELIACQASQRGGVIYGRVCGKRVYLGGKAELYGEDDKNGKYF